MQLFEAKVKAVQSEKHSTMNVTAKPTHSKTIAKGWVGAKLKESHSKATEKGEERQRRVEIREPAAGSREPGAKRRKPRRGSRRPGESLAPGEAKTHLLHSE